MHPDPNPVYVLLAIFTPVAIVGVILGTISILVYQRIILRSRELAADLIMQMLARKHTVEEIERVLLAWSHDAEFAKSMAKARKQLAASKPEPHFA
jgi:Tfp pilus assembly protein PilE